LFVCIEQHEQFFSYMAAGDKAANLDLSLALPAYSSRELLRVELQVASKTVAFATRNLVL
jgi:hypothetical protein